MDRHDRHCPNHARRIHVSARRRPFRQAVTSNVQGNDAFPPEPLHEAFRQPGHDILSRVRPPLVLPFTASAHDERRRTAS